MTQRELHNYTRNKCYTVSILLWLVFARFLLQLPILFERCKKQSNKSVKLKLRRKFDSSQKRRIYKIWISPQIFRICFSYKNIYKVYCCFFYDMVLVAKRTAENWFKTNVRQLIFRFCVKNFIPRMRIRGYIIHTVHHKVRGILCPFVC